MMTASRILGDQVGSTAPAFLAFLAIHVVAGLTAVITGAIAALARKGSPRHILGMGVGYTAMLTAFYVDNGPHLPLWDHLPTLAFWLLPGAVAAPLIARAVIHARRPSPPPADHQISGAGRADLRSRG